MYLTLIPLWNLTLIRHVLSLDVCKLLTTTVFRYILSNVKIKNLQMKIWFLYSSTPPQQREWTVYNKPVSAGISYIQFRVSQKQSYAYLDLRTEELNKVSANVISRYKYLNAFFQWERPFSGLSLSPPCFHNGIY